MILVALLTGCMTVGRTKGAIPLEKGQYEFVAQGPTVRSFEDPGVLGAIPVIPQGGFELRAGTGADTDVGVQMYLLGAGFDLRHRFVHEGPWHVAVAPGIGAIISPNLLNPLDFGAIEAKLPLTAEFEARKWLSLSAGPQVVLRERANLGVAGIAWRFDAWTMFGARAEFHGGLIAIGISGDAFYIPTRFTGKLGFVGGLDLRLRTRTRQQANAKRRKRDKPPKWPDTP